MKNGIQKICLLLIAFHHMDVNNLSQFELLYEQYKQYNKTHKSKRNTEFQKYRSGNFLTYPFMLLDIGQKNGHIVGGDTYFTFAHIHKSISLNSGIFTLTIKTLLQLGYIEKLSARQSRLISCRYKLNYEGHKFYKITEKGFKMSDMFQTIMSDFDNTTKFRRMNEDNDNT